jgi:hypothetical protein
MELGFVFRGHRFLYLAVDHFREAERVFKELNFNQGLVMWTYSGTPMILCVSHRKRGVEFRRFFFHFVWGNEVEGIGVAC